MIQIDMPMPESCVECRFSQGGYMYCHAMPENFCGYVNYCEENGRPEWCPLKAHEPRVMTLEEVQSCENAMWIELLGGKLSGKGFYAFVLDRMKNGILEISTRAAYLRYYSKDYNVKWRCWTGCSTQE